MDTAAAGSREATTTSDGDHAHTSALTKRFVHVSGRGMADHPFLIATRYHALRYLGEGSYGVVASARDSKENDANVAIKRIHNAFNSVTDAKHLLREVRLWHALSHPNLLPLLDIDMPLSYRTWTDVYVVSPLKPYTLSKRLSLFRSRHPHQPLPDDIARRVLVGILRCLKYLHSANVVHRDLKPENILLDEDWTPFICDLGLARTIDSDDAGNLSVNVATRPYRAPELFITPDDYNSSMDIWSVGCIIHELLDPGCKPLFSKGYRSQLDTIFSVIGSPSEDALRGTVDEAGRWFIRNLRLQKNRKPIPFEKRFEDGVNIAAMNPELVDLMSKLLVYVPKARLTAQEALHHPYLVALSSPEAEPSFDQSRLAEIAALEPEPTRRPSLSREDLRRQLWDVVCRMHAVDAVSVINSGGGPDEGRTSISRR